MRICLISPGHVSTNPRLVKEADALSAAGHHVTVIAATYQAWAREADKAFAAAPWRIQPPLPFGPLAPPARRVIQIARQRSALALFRCGVRHPAVARAALHQITPDLVSAAEGVEADLYVAHYPAALPAAAIAAEGNGGIYAFDAEDFHLGELADGLRPTVGKELVESVERRYLPDAAYITAASPGIADAYAETYALPRPTVLLNVFPTAQAPNGPTARGSAVPGPSVYWFSQTIGPHRGLETAVRAIGLSDSRPHLYLRGAPAGGFIGHLERLAKALGAGDRLHILAPETPPEMARLAAQFDIGLVGETGYSENRRIALTNKQFTYLLAGLPFVASDVQAHRQLAPELNCAMILFSIDDAVSLAATFDGLLLSPARLAKARATAFRLGQERFNWDIEKGVLLNCVERALGARGRAPK